MLVAPWGACTPASSDVAWALDTFTLVPDGDALTGQQSWSLYDARWENSGSEDHRVCGVTVQLAGTPMDAPACARCELAWEIVATISEHDCERGVPASLNLLDGLTGIGLGEVPPRLVDEAEHEGAVGSWVRYPSDGWKAHGWAGHTRWWNGNPEATSWDGKRSLEARPAYAWDVRPL
jgi:hypothetical protein